LSSAFERKKFRLAEENPKYQYPRQLLNDNLDYYQFYFSFAESWGVDFLPPNFSSQTFQDIFWILRRVDVEKIQNRLI